MAKIFVTYISPRDGTPKARIMHTYRDAGMVCETLRRMGANPIIRTSLEEPLPLLEEPWEANFSGAGL